MDQCKPNEFELVHRLDFPLKRIEHKRLCIFYSSYIEMFQSSKYSSNCCLPFSTDSLSRYLRVKRLNQTYFIMCNEDDTVGYLKEQISLATKQETKAEHMRIINPKDKTPLDNDSEKLSKYEELKSESELYVVFQISEDEWEGVHVEDTDAAMSGGVP